MFGVKTGYGQNLWKQLAGVGQPEGGVIGLGSKVCPGQESKSIMDGAGLGARAVGRSLLTGTPLPPPGQEVPFFSPDFLVHLS